jgi:hypothetical protein
MIKKPQRGRPRPDLGCRSIGWMDLVSMAVVIIVLCCEVVIFTQYRLFVVILVLFSVCVVFLIGHLAFDAAY